MIPYKTDTEISSYIIFPRFLISLDLSNDAKVLYALLLDRAGISRKKGYIEADGTIRLYFTVAVSYTHLDVYKRQVRRITLAERLRKIPLSFFGKKDLADLTLSLIHI